MTPRGRQVVNLAASVRQRLLNLARDRGEEFQLVLSDYAVERLLYRLSVSAHAERFVLKGAKLLRLWFPERHRATWDLDLLGRVDKTIDTVVTIVRELCSAAAEEGIVFDRDTVSGEEIRSSDENVGVRVKLTAELAGAKIPMQVDVGFGDAVIPRPTEETYPTLLDDPAPKLLTYPREAVVAEKLEAMVSLGVTTSRMKDSYDVHSLATFFGFDGRILSEAIAATFRSRQNSIPVEEPVALSMGFLRTPDRATQWRGFLRRSRLEGAPENIEELASVLRSFLLPPLEALGTGNRFDATWHPGGPWQVH